MENQTVVRNFVLLGFTDVQNLKPLIFVILLLTYILTIMGNIVIVTITLLDRRLQTPMYYFLWNVSLLEIGFTSTVIPKALLNLASGSRTISIPGCFVQAFLYFVLGTTAFLLFAVISFDRYVAICHPLSYTTIMNERVCRLLVLSAWASSFLLLIGPLLAIFQLPFCNQNIIHHFFCDSGPLIKLACADTRLLELASAAAATFSLLGTLLITIVSYARIISTVLNIPSASGRQKAFSTCMSHLTVVSISYSSCIFMYIKPVGSRGLDLSKGVSVLNTVVSPLLNPFIYSLRNKQVQEALRQAFAHRTIFFKKTKSIMA